MPAYATIMFDFAKASRPGLVRRFYERFVTRDVTFFKAFEWGCPPDLSLEQIIEWNQQKLDDDFIIGDDEHVSNDYRQVLFSAPPFSECRVFILNEDNAAITFHCIVPESEIEVTNCGSLLAAAEQIWSDLPVRVIDTCWELDDTVSYNGLSKGIVPTARLFAFVDELSPEIWMERFEVQCYSRGFRLHRKDALRQEWIELE